MLFFCSQRPPRRPPEENVIKEKPPEKASMNKQPSTQSIDSDISGFEPHEEIFAWAQFFQIFRFENNHDCMNEVPRSKWIDFHKVLYVNINDNFSISSLKVSDNEEQTFRPNNTIQKCLYQNMPVKRREEKQSKLSFLNVPSLEAPDNTGQTFRPNNTNQKCLRQYLSVKSKGVEHDKGETNESTSEQTGYQEGCYERICTDLAFTK